jgi:hypothetical protein
MQRGGRPEWARATSGFRTGWQSCRGSSCLEDHRRPSACRARNPSDPSVAPRITPDPSVTGSPRQGAPRPKEGPAALSSVPNSRLDRVVGDALRPVAREYLIKSAGKCQRRVVRHDLRLAGPESAPGCRRLLGQGRGDRAGARHESDLGPAADQRGSAASTAGRCPTYRVRRSERPLELLAAYRREARDLRPASVTLAGAATLHSQSDGPPDG